MYENKVSSRPKPVIGVLLDTIRHGYQERILQGISRGAEKHNLNLVCFLGLPYTANEQTFARLIRESGIAGLVALAGAIGGELGLQNLRSFVERCRPLPVVSIGDLRLPWVGSIRVDNRTGILSAVKHLVEEHGIIDIVFVGRNQNLDVVERFSAWREALKIHRIPYSEEFVIDAGLSKADGERVYRELRNRRRGIPRALVVANDECAIGLMSSLTSAGIRVPEDIAVVGFDGIGESGFVAPALTTVRQPLERNGEMALDDLLCRIFAQRFSSANPPLQTALVRRRSCGCDSRNLQPAEVMSQLQVEFEKGWRGRAIDEAAFRLRACGTVASLMNELEACLNRLDLYGCYVSAFQSSGSGPQQTARTMLAYRNGERLGKLEGCVFPAGHLMPEDPGRKNCAVKIVQPLRFADRQLGMCVFEVAPQLWRQPSAWCSYEDVGKELSLSYCAAVQATEAGQRETRRQRELAALQAIDAAIAVGANGSDAQQILATILSEVKVLYGAAKADAYWVNPVSGVLELQANDSGRWYGEKIVAAGIVREAVEQRKTIVLSEGLDNYSDISGAAREVLVVPLQHEGCIIGAMKLETATSGCFTLEDQRFVERQLAHLAVLGVRSVATYDQLKNQIRPYRALSVLAVHVQKAGISEDLQTVLRLILTGITANQGAGFSRAMLFVLDENSKTLRGRLAIGAQTASEAFLTWQQLGSELPDSDDTLSLHEILRRAEAFAGEVRDDELNDSLLCRAVVQASFDVDRLQGALLSAIRHTVPSIVKDGVDDPIRDLVADVTGNHDRGRAIACLPIVGREGTAIGVLLADNRFLLHESYIEEGSLRTLGTFALLAGLSIENSRLAVEAAEKQKLEAFQEFAAKTRRALHSHMQEIESSCTTVRARLGTGNIPSATTAADRLSGRIADAQFILTQLDRFSST